MSGFPCRETKPCPVKLEKSRFAARISLPEQLDIPIIRLRQTAEPSRAGERAYWAIELHQKRNGVVATAPSSGSADNGFVDSGSADSGFVWKLSAVRTPRLSHRCRSCVF